MHLPSYLSRVLRPRENNKLQISSSNRYFATRNLNLKSEIEISVIQKFKSTHSSQETRPTLCINLKLTPSATGRNIFTPLDLNVLESSF